MGKQAEASHAERFPPQQNQVTSNMSLCQFVAEMADAVAFVAYPTLAFHALETRLEC